ncbi:MAG: hypothetical protein ABW194_04155 [Novosphingobium sp.]
MTHRIGPFARTAIVAAVAVTLPFQAASQPRPSPATTCVSEAELRGMVAFAMPSAIEGVVNNCSPHLVADGFLRRNGADMVAGYAAGKATAWPLARIAFLKLAAEKDRDSVEMVEKMPDTALQPFVEAIIAGLVGAKLKPAQCVLADKMLRLLAPLPPENTVELLSTIVALAGGESKKGAAPALAVCRA